MNDLSSFPYKFPLYQAEPWKTKGYREMVTTTDAVIYTVDEAAATVTIHLVSTIGRDIPKHLTAQDR